MCSPGMQACARIGMSVPLRYAGSCVCVCVWLCACVGEGDEKSGPRCHVCAELVSCEPVPNAEAAAFGGLAGNFPFPERCPSVHRSAAGRTEVFPYQ